MYKYILISVIIIIIIIFLIKFIDYVGYKMLYKMYLFESKSEDIVIMNKFNTTNNNKVISLSLYGNNPYYYKSAFKIKEDIPQYFPNWELRLYIHYKAPIKIIREFIDKGCQVIIIKQDNVTPSDSTFWRFLAAQDNVTFLSRDADYQLNDFDYKQVTRWMKEDKTDFIKYMHTNAMNNLEMIIRGDKVFYAGLWGGRNKCVPDMLNRINANKYRRHWRSDELFLETIIWEKYCKDRGITVVIDKKGIKKIFNKSYINLHILDGSSPLRRYIQRPDFGGRVKKMIEFFV